MVMSRAGGKTDKREAVLFWAAAGIPFSVTTLKPGGKLMMASISKSTSSHEQQRPRYSAQVASKLSDQDAAALGDIFVALVAQGHALSCERLLSKRLRHKNNRLLVARAVDEHNTIVGTTYVELAVSENAHHRAGISKLLVHPEYHRRGIGAVLLKAAEDAARAHGRTLLILDTQANGVAVPLYRKCGWTEVGDIPDYSRLTNGELAAVKMFWKRLPAAK
ncbi:acyl-CoA N-acyltransferase [Powellomyces hirtus]|nr:acyl-CoA N-acyltransferase [Powellomyces hirtus]